MHVERIGTDNTNTTSRNYLNHSFVFR